MENIKDIEEIDSLFQKELMDDFIPVEDWEIESMIARFNGQQLDNCDNWAIPLSNEFMTELITNLELIKLDELGYQKNKEYNKARTIYNLNNIKTCFDKCLLGGISIFELYIVFSMQYNSIPFSNIYISSLIYPVFDYCRFLIRKNKETENNPEIDRLLKTLCVILASSGVLYTTINYLDKGNLYFLSPIFLYPLLQVSYNLIKNDNMRYDYLDKQLSELELELGRIDKKTDEKIKVLKDDRIYMDSLFRQD